MQKVFQVYNDPGHGWIKVPTRLLIELDIDQVISSFSYLSRDGKNAFLEEDCDATLFIDAMRERGIEPEFRDNYADNRSKVRCYPGYQPEWVAQYKDYNAGLVIEIDGDDKFIAEIIGEVQNV